MIHAGVFIVLYDHETLALYLSQGIYGSHMLPAPQGVRPSPAHFATLADYGCIREGTHIFFFLERRIYYGGQAVGSREHGAFYLNGQHSPMGRAARAPLVWDESARTGTYTPEGDGCFRRPGLDEPAREKVVCIPYIIQFQDRLGLRGRSIVSDEFYFELGAFPQPLPSNSMQGMSFCLLTPAEARIALRLLEGPAAEENKLPVNDSVRISGTPTPFRPSFGIDRPGDALVEAHLEAAITAHPDLLWRFVPKELYPRGAAIARQIPISPFKPFQMDRTDLCFFEEPLLREGSLPNLIVELKRTQAGKPAFEQVGRYLRWLDKRFPAEAPEVRILLAAPAFVSKEAARARDGRFHLINYSEERLDTS